MRALFSRMRGGNASNTPHKEKEKQQPILPIPSPLSMTPDSSTRELPPLTPSGDDDLGVPERMMLLPDTAHPPSNTAYGRSTSVPAPPPQEDSMKTPKQVAFVSPSATSDAVSATTATTLVRSPLPNSAASSTPRMGGYTPEKALSPPSTSSMRALVPPPRTPTRNPSTSYLNEAASMRSGTPHSFMSGRASSIQAAASWSEAAEDDLVSNLGPRERTRQEVLWEIVASEDRYVVELLKLKETFIDPLLHPYSTTVPLDDPLVVSDAYLRAETPMSTRSGAPPHPRQSLDNLPIASRFLSTPPPPYMPAAQASSSSKSSSQGQRSGLGSNVPMIPDAEMEDAGATNSGSDGEDDDLGRGYASGANRLPVHNSPYGIRPSSNANHSIRNAIPRHLPFPTASGARSHQSLPPPPRQIIAQGRVSTTSLGNGRGGFGSADGHGKGASSPAGRVAKRFLGATSNVTMPHNPGGGPSSGSGTGLPPHLLPEDLRQCLEILEGGILQGHIALSDGLRKRYEEQYPLVRSLADVFVSNSHILRGYATYVLHLERALEQVDDALSSVSLAKKPKKQDVADWIHVSRVLRQLEENAAEKGETGLAISLSKPFQRLLKYPLLFRNLLFHTDPSTFEYESTLEMVAEVENIVRSIEDEKIQKEERDKTRDVLARIEGLEKNKALAAPKASRQLVQERSLATPSIPNADSSSKAAPGPQSGTLPPVTPPSKAVQGKSSFRRLSDVLTPGGSSSNPTLGGKKDIWLVVFNDVVLRCQRTGTTTLPLASPSAGGGGPPGRAHSLPELQSKGKYNTVGRRSMQVGRPRNLYKFLKIETWTIGDVAQPRAGVVAMADITKVRTAGGSPLQKQQEEDEEVADDGASDDSDRKSKMSFSYWGADKVTVQAPAAKARGKQAAKTAIAARRGPIPTSYSTANAKFGTRLRSPEPGDAPGTIRPNSRRTGPAPMSSLRKVSTENSQPNKPPAWGSMSSARQHPSTIPAIVARRSQKLSAPTPPRNGVQPPASPAPSELTQDSGVGLYRDVLAQNPSFNRDSDHL